MDSLSPGQFSLVYNMMSLTVAAMGAGAFFFFLSRGQVAQQYRPALLVSGLVVVIACYHYIRIFLSWDAAYTLEEGRYVLTGQFNDAYRYVDWLLTVPLLLVELVAVINLEKGKARSLLTKLVIASILMIAFGYPGEISAVAGTKWLFWAISMVPFLYIMYVLWIELSGSLDKYSANVRSLISGARLLILITWSFYPIAYLLPIFGVGSGTGVVGLQIGYTVADILSKVGLGVYVYFIAVAKTQEAGDAVPA